MKLPIFALSSVLVAGSVTTSSAQVIQLPTFKFFSVSTTVSVPVNGGVYLGGVKRAQYGMTSRGTPGLGKIPGAGRLFGNRGFASSHSATGASVTATIIDHEAMDAALLAEAAARRRGTVRLSETDRKALILSAHVARGAEPGLKLGAAAPRESVAAIRRRHDAAERAHLAEMQEYWDRGQQAEALGRNGAARVSYDVIARRGTGELRERALARLARLRRPGGSSKSHPATTNRTHPTGKTVPSTTASSGTAAGSSARRLP